MVKRFNTTGCEPVMRGFDSRYPPQPAKSPDCIGVFIFLETLLETLSTEERGRQLRVARSPIPEYPELADRWLTVRHLGYSAQLAAQFKGRSITSIEIREKKVFAQTLATRAALWA